MIAPLTSPLFGFIVSVAAGFLLGAFYDIFRIWRAFLHSEKRAVFFQDLFYMAMAAVFTFLLALAVSEGEVRYYLLGGEAVGWFAYYFTVGQVTGRLSRWISRLLYRFLFNPLGKLFRRVRGYFVGKCHIFLAFLLKLARNAKKCLKHRRKVVYNLRDRMYTEKGISKGLRDHESHKRTKVK